MTPTTIRSKALSISATTTTRYLPPGGHETAYASPPDLFFTAPAPGLITGFCVLHEEAAGNGHPIVYELVRNGAPTGHLIEAPSDKDGWFAQLSMDGLAVSPADRIVVEIRKDRAIGKSPKVEVRYAFTLSPARLTPGGS